MLAFLYRMQRATPQPAHESLYVDAIATAPTFRRLGVGRAMLAAAEQEARDRGLIRVGLETEVTNTPARGLYESCGYVAGPQGARVPGLPRYVRYVRELGAIGGDRARRASRAATRRASGPREQLLGQLAGKPALADLGGDRLGVVVDALDRDP